MPIDQREKAKEDESASEDREISITAGAIGRL